MSIHGYPPRDVYNPYAVYGISVIYREHIVHRGGKPYIAACVISHNTHVQNGVMFLCSSVLIQTQSIRSGWRTHPDVFYCPSYNNCTSSMLFILSKNSPWFLPCQDLHTRSGMNGRVHRKLKTGVRGNSCVTYNLRIQAHQAANGNNAQNSRFYAGLDVSIVKCVCLSIHWRHGRKLSAYRISLGI